MPTWVASNYNRLATHYDFLVRLFFGNKLARAQFHFISEIEHGDILILGGGTGDILLECLKYFPKSHYKYIDVAPKMVALTQEKVTEKYPNSNVEYKIGGVECIDSSSKFDSIVLPFILDSLSEVELNKLFELLRKVIKKDGKLLFTDFYYSERNLFWKAYSIVLITGLYIFFNIVCGVKRYHLPDYGLYFGKMKLLREKSFLKGSIRSQVYTQ